MDRPDDPTRQDTPQQRSTVHRLEGTFDLPAARLLENSLRGLGKGAQVRIDFSRVRTFHDFGIAALAQTLLKLDGATVKVEGLRMHQVRLLRYFGVDADVFRGGGPARGGDED